MDHGRRTQQRMKTATGAPAITMEQRRRQYELEQLARHDILTSTRATRGEATRIAYDRLYREAPWHPDLQLSREVRMARVYRQATLLTRHARQSRRVLEVGCGSGDLITYLAEHHPAVEFTGVDISAEKLNSAEHERTANLRFRTGDCVEPHDVDGPYDLVISSQVLEHFHPDDVPPHLRAVRGLLRPGGTFELDTPNRHTGPHDVSVFFTPEPSGTHLKEWTFSELRRAFKEVGFRRVRTDVPFLAHLRRVAPVPGDTVLMPVEIKVALEAALRHVPGRALRRTLFRVLRMDNIVVYAQTGK